MSFAQSFWPINNKYRVSLGKLDERIQKSVSENNQILTFIKSRVSIEELYGQSLKDLAGTKKIENTTKIGVIDLPEEGASLGRSYDALKESSIILGESHLNTAKSIRETVLEPFERISKDYHQVYLLARDNLLAKVSQFEKHFSILKIARKSYSEKCKIADELEESAVTEAHRQEEANNLVPKSTVTYLFGKLVFSDPDLNAFLRRAQSEALSQETRSMFLGLFRGLQSGESIVQWLLHAYGNELKTPADAVEVGQALIDQNFLRLIGPGNQFYLASTAFYQWKKLAENLEDGEPSHFQARKLASEADQHYRNAVKKCDQLRTLLEEENFSYLEKMQENEETRIESIKRAFLSMAHIEIALSNNVKPIGEELIPQLETLKPKQDIALMIEACSTGPFRPNVILYDNHYHGSGIDQAFGVPIDVQARATKAALPSTLKALLSALDQVLDLYSEQEKLSVWCHESSLEDVHNCRASINTAFPSEDSLFGCEAGILASTLRLFLLELPDGVIPESFYENLRTICSESNEKVRWEALSTKLNELSISQRSILHNIIRRLRPMIATIDQNDLRFKTLLTKFSSCLIRSPEHLASSSLHDRHPQRIIKDLLLCSEEFVPIEPSEAEFAEWLALTTQAPVETELEPIPVESTPPAKLPSLSSPDIKSPLLGDPQSDEGEDYLDLELDGLGETNDDDPETLIDLKDDFFDKF